jgi:hypothetical protein
VLSPAGNTSPVTLQNVALSAAGSSDLISGTTAGDLNINQDFLTVGNVNSAVSANTGGQRLGECIAGTRQAGVAQAFLVSTEFRSDVVRSFYGDPTLTPVPFLPFLPDLLHRTSAPSASDVSTWVNSGLDLSTVEIGFAGSPEFFVQA